MKLSWISFLFILVFLLIPSFADAQTPRSVTAAANKSWPTFFAQFRAAIVKRDRDALKPMISSEFDWTNGELGISPDDVLWNLDNDGKWRKGKPNMWALLQKSLVIGHFKSAKYGSRPGRHNYVRNDSVCAFVFEADGRWRWQRFLGD
ncbi:MAG: hypothetical protein ACKVRN_10095 [Pyrinomonadaceae bacterium]